MSRCNKDVEIKCSMERIKKRCVHIMTITHVVCDRVSCTKLIFLSKLNMYFTHSQQYTAPHRTARHYTTLHYTTLLYTTPHYTTLHYTTLHHTTLHHTTLHRTTHLPNSTMSHSCAISSGVKSENNLILSFFELYGEILSSS